MGSLLVIVLRPLVTVTPFPKLATDHVLHTGTGTQQFLQVNTVNIHVYDTTLFRQRTLVVVFGLSVRWFTSRGAPCPGRPTVAGWLECCSETET